MRIITRVRLIEYWTMSKTSFMILLSLLVFTMSAYIIISFGIPDILSKQPGVLGIIGSLLGALVGGFMALFGSFYAQKRQQSYKSVILRKNVIYTPLYNELVAVKEIIRTNPYPLFFEFRLGRQTLNPHPQFGAWERIKRDSRKLQVPLYLAEALEKFEKTVRTQQALREKAATQLQLTAHAKIEEQLTTKCRLGNLGDVLLADILIEGKPLTQIYQEHIENYLDNKPIMPPEDISKFIQELHSSAMKLEPVAILIEVHQDLVFQLDDLIEALATIIKIVNKNAEFQSIHY